MQTTSILNHLEPVAKMSKDIIKDASNLGQTELRSLVDKYYQMQDDRIRSSAQVRESEASNESHSALDYLSDQSLYLEKQIQRILTKYVEQKEVGIWLIHNKGIAGVLSAGLLAHIDINKAPTAGHIWNYAGLNPNIKWEKGQRRPFNAQLKTLCWKIGESFVKVSGSKDSFYGQEYAKRKLFETERNQNDYYKDHASKQLEQKKFSKSTDAYKCYIKGKLPPAHVHAIAKRWVVKLFLSHLHAVWYEHATGKKAPVPYAIAHLNHAHLIEPPHTIEEALKKS